MDDPLLPVWEDQDDRLALAQGAKQRLARVGGVRGDEGRSARISLRTPLKGVAEALEGKLGSHDAYAEDAATTDTSS